LQLLNFESGVMSVNNSGKIESEEIILDTIEEAIEDIRLGKIIIVVDDDDRENEGDMICASACVTSELITFMSREARGLICISLPGKRCDELNLGMMVKENTALHQTAFTVSVDLIGYGCTTGISSHDRAKTILALINPATRPEELGAPGHLFPLKTRDGGVLERPGHTEAASDFAALAGHGPSGVLVEILNDDGSMARLPDLRKVADKFGMKLVSILKTLSRTAWRTNVDRLRGSFSCFSLQLQNVKRKLPFEFCIFNDQSFSKI
jgi:3,4-dihydroxy 2-butanone 4-phosphate synthase / GTP cyclohydrolase II